MKIFARFPHAALLFAACGVAGPRPASAQTLSAATQAVVVDAQAKVEGGRFAEAVDALTAAQTPALTPDDKQVLDVTLAYAQEAWGGTLMQNHRDEEALTHLNAALAIDSHAPSRRAPQGTDLLLIGAAYDDLSQYEKAIGFYQQALPIYREVGDHNGEANLFNCLGLAYDGLNQYVKATRFFQQALPIYRELGDRKAAANALANLDIVSRRLDGTR